MPNLGSISLQRGANTALSELIPGGNGPIAVGFGWNIIQGNGPATELVASAVLCDASGKALSDEHLVFFNQLASPDGAVKYVTDGDQEELDLDLPAVPEDVEKIVFVVYADPDVRKPGNFGGVRGAYIRISDVNGRELVRYEIEEGSGVDVTAMIFGEVYRNKGAWKLRAVGQGYKTGLAGVAKDFGVAI
ncbi:MAG: TerD family protein [Solirubrobacteraceae bacterium]|nr:TerD family protein [Patulibacter sp.]